MTRTSASLNPPVVNPPTYCVEPWNESVGWSAVSPVAVNRFHTRSQGFQPHTTVQVARDGSDLMFRFEVKDRFVIARHLTDQKQVCRDSCVEFFFSPSDGPSYFNLEMNCLGTVLFHFQADGLRAHTEEISAKWIASLSVASSLPREVIEPERDELMTWTITGRLPWALVQAHEPAAADPADPTSRWKANFFKCGTAPSSHHYASWAPLPEVLDFHAAVDRGCLTFGTETGADCSS